MVSRLNFPVTMLVLVSFSSQAAPPAQSTQRNVLINGVNVEGLTNQTYEHVTVRIDARGDVNIDAPKYVIKKITKDEPRLVTPLSMRYFLVTERDGAGGAEYQVEVTLNGKLLRTVRSSEPAAVVDITKDVMVGDNAVRMHATKRYDKTGQRKSTSAESTFRVTVGEGTSTTTSMNVDRKLISFVRNASETDEMTEDYTFTAR